MNHSNVTSSKVAASDGASDKPDEVVAAAKELATEASGVGSELKDLAGGVAREAQKNVEKNVDERKGRIAESLGGVAEALRQTTSGDSKVSPEIRPLVTKAAEQVDRVSHYLERSSPSTMVADVQAFARREPALFLGGAFVLGLVGGRFLKASKPTEATATTPDDGGYAARSRNAQARRS